jgi:hypothetical protein
MAKTTHNQTIISGHMAILFHLEIIRNSLPNNDLCQWPKMAKLKKAAIVAIPKE